MARGEPVVKRNSQEFSSSRPRCRLRQNRDPQAGSNESKRGGHKIRFVPRIEDEAFAVCDGLDSFPDTAVATRQNQVICGRLAQGDLLLRRERLACRSKNHQTILKQGSCSKVCNSAMSCSDSEIYLPFENGVTNALRDNVGNLHANPWIRLQEATYQLRKYTGADGGESSYGDEAGGNGTQIACVFHDGLRIIEQPLQWTKNVSPCGRERHPAFASIKELNAQTVLELLDLNSQRRLGHMQIICGASKVACLRNLQECTNMTKLVDYRRSRL